MHAKHIQSLFKPLTSHIFTLWKTLYQNMANSNGIILYAIVQIAAKNLD